MDNPYDHGEDGQAQGDLSKDFYGMHHLSVAPFSSFRFPVVDDSRVQMNEGFFCDWYPALFGIDEDDIPDSENEECVFDVDWDDLQEKALELTDSQLERMRVGSWECLSREEVRANWLRTQQPVYGRRARLKPMLRNEKNEPFECICDIDRHYSRHYVPNFGGGVAKEGEELKIPHFKAFWEDLKDRREMGDLERLSKIFNPEEPAKEEVLQRPDFKFKGMKKSNLKKFRKDLLATFRPLHCREVRRYRMPFSEALYLELQEDGCLDAAAFFKYLIIKDYFVHEAPDNSGPCLRDNRFLLNRIFELLKIAERFSRREEYHKETILYLRTGKYFSDDKNWWWLAEEFYTKAVKASQNCVIDGGKSEAISNYILGTFLLDCVHRVQGAQEHLLRARELSMGKDWSARNILRKPQDTVHKECATYLCRALIAASKELRDHGKPEEALPLIHRSYKLCMEVESWRSDIEMETYFELGMTYQALGMLEWAKAAYKKFIGFAEMINHVKGICDGYLELAICHRSEGDQERCLRNILSYLSAATLKENQNLIAFGNRYLGEFHLNTGNCEEAVKYFEKAFNAFLQQFTKCSEIPFADWQPQHFTLREDVELTRVLIGLAEGEMLTRQFCELILDAKDSNNVDKMLQLIKWKDSGDKSYLKMEPDPSHKYDYGVFSKAVVLGEQKSNRNENPEDSSSGVKMSTGVTIRSKTTTI